MDFETIETFCKFGKWLALTPHSCQNKNPSCLHRCHNFLVFAIYIAGVINVHHALVPIYLSLTHIQLILAILINANYYLFSSYILVVVMGLKRNQWSRLIHGLKSTQTVPTRQPIVVSVTLVTYLSVLICHTFVIKSYFGFYSLVLFLPLNFYRWAQFLYSLCACAVLNMLLTRYRHLTNMLQVKHEELLIIKRIKREVLVLKKCVDAFNNIFGWTILSSIFTVAFKCLVYIDIFLKDKKAFQEIWDAYGRRLDLLFEVASILLMWVQIFYFLFVPLDQHCLL
jgi:hypothetical protein